MVHAKLLLDGAESSFSLSLPLPLFPPLEMYRNDISTFHRKFFQHFDFSLFQNNMNIPNSKAVEFTAAAAAAVPLRRLKSFFFLPLRPPSFSSVCDVESYVLFAITI